MKTVRRMLRKFTRSSAIASKLTLWVIQYSDLGVTCGLRLTASPNNVFRYPCTPWFRRERERWCNLFKGGSLRNWGWTGTRTGTGRWPRAVVQQSYCKACSGQSTRDQEWSKKVGLLPSLGHQILVKRSMIGTEAACHIKISFLGDSNFTLC